MDSTILAAIIGGFSTVGAGILAVLLTRLLDNPMGFKKNSRQAALEGHWSGTVHQEGGVDYQINFQLKPAGRAIRGEGHLLGVNQSLNIDEPLTVFGGFVHERFLKLEYTLEAQRGTIQFGFALMELDPDGQTLYGSFVGYGAIVTKAVVTGKLRLQRQGASTRASVSSPKTI